MKSVELQFTTLEFHENYVISRVKEDHILDKPEVNEMLQILQTHYNDEAYVYIALRNEKYNVNPLIYLNLPKVSTCAGIIIICKDWEACKTAEFEKTFSKIPFKIVHDLESGIACAEDLLKK